MKVVLLIDGSSSFLKLVEIIIKRLGYRAFTANSSGSALQKLRQNLPDMVMCEANLPDGKGLDLFRSIKADPTTRDTTLIMVTTDNSEKTRKAAIECGCSDFLAKPVTTRQIFQVLEQNIGNKRRQKIRTDLALRVEVQEGGRKYFLYTHNFGEGGVFLKSAAPLPLGSVLDLSLELPRHPEPLQVQGEVVYSFGESAGGHPAGMGIRFINLDAETSVLLSTFTENSLTESIPPDAAG